MFVPVVNMPLDLAAVIYSRRRRRTQTSGWPRLGKVATAGRLGRRPLAGGQRHRSTSAMDEGSEMVAVTLVKAKANS